MVLCFLIWIAHVESYIMLWSVLSVVALPQVIQWSFPQRENKTMKVTYESLIWIPYVFSLEYSEGITYQKFIRESNASYYFVIETIV